MEEKDSVNEDKVINIPYSAELNKHSFAESIDTIRHRENGKKDIHEHNNQTQITWFNFFSAKMFE